MASSRSPHGALPGGERPLAEISVADNGPGIEPEVLTRLFEPYVTSKKKGTGLGLAIVKKLVEEHGGTVAAENLPDRGARLVVRLPVRAARPRRTVSETRTARAEPGGKEHDCRTHTRGGRRGRHPHHHQRHPGGRGLRRERRLRMPPPPALKWAASGPT